MGEITTTVKCKVCNAHCFFKYISFLFSVRTGTRTQKKPHQGPKQDPNRFSDTDIIVTL